MANKRNVIFKAAEKIRLKLSNVSRRNMTYHAIISMTYCNCIKLISFKILVTVPNATSTLIIGRLS